MRKYEETIQFRDDKTAESTNNATEEINHEYDVIDDTVEEDGTRVIRLKVSQQSKEAVEQRRQLVETLLVALGEEESKAFRGLLENVMGVTGAVQVKELHQRVVKEKQPVKTSKGCFEIVVGKGRRGRDRIPIYGGY